MAQTKPKPKPVTPTRSTKPTAGRPKGAPNKQVDQVVAEPSRCKTCHSTDREAYHAKQEIESPGVDLAGKPYTHVIWRRTKCLTCGQHRIDRTYENRRVAPAKKSAVGKDK